MRLLIQAVYKVAIGLVYSLRTPVDLKATYNHYIEGVHMWLTASLAEPDRFWGGKRSGSARLYS